MLYKLKTFFRIMVSKLFKQLIDCLVSLKIIVYHIIVTLSFNFCLLFKYCSPLKRNTFFLAILLTT